MLCLAPNCEVENQYTPIGKCCPTCKAPVFCTQEAKLCPDGTYVGRDSNNNCEFFPCPDGMYSLLLVVHFIRLQFLNESFLKISLNSRNK